VKTQSNGKFGIFVTGGGPAKERKKKLRGFVRESGGGARPGGKPEVAMETAKAS